MIAISNNTEKECYWCGRPATSKEHIPPKCLFPESKDISEIYDIDFRKELITVPSCDEHNNKKSGDDEILLACLSSAFGANDVAYIHLHTKLKRTYLRNPNIVKSSFNILDQGIVEVEGHKFPVAFAEVDNVKMLKTFEGIARGLYMHEFKERFVGKCKVVPIFVGYEEKASRRDLYITLAKIMVEQEQPKWAIKGANPKIFAYQFGPIDEYKLRPMVMTFYKTLKVFAAYVPDDNTFPFDKIKR